MIRPPSGWQSQIRRDTVLLTHPGGIGVAAMRYDERLRPIARVSDLVDAEATPVNFSPSHRWPIERLVTDEGEHAALVTQEGKIQDARAEITFGFVFLDDFYARLRVVTLDPSVFEEIRALAMNMLRGDAQLLGRVRRRRYFHAMPPGWHGSGGLFDARWHPPDYPSNPATLLVSPAIPKAPGFIDSLLASIIGSTGEVPTTALVRPMRTVHTTQGLVGERWHLRVGDRHVYLALLQDDAFSYAVRLDARPHDLAAEQVFVELVDSIEPIPTSREGRALETSINKASLFWAE